MFKLSRTIFLLTLSIVIITCSSQKTIINSNTNKSIAKPEEREKIALSNYNTARAYENEFYKENNSTYAKIAIERFETYYIYSPSGTYAALSLLRKAELYYHLGELGNARYELNRVKSRYDFRKDYQKEIQYIEELIK